MFYRGGLDFVAPVLMDNTTFQAQLVFQNLTSVLSGDSGVCSACSREIVMLIHTVLINEVGDRSSLVNATGRYASQTVMVRVDTLNYSPSTYINCYVCISLISIALTEVYGIFPINIGRVKEYRH